MSAIPEVETGRLQFESSPTKLVRTYHKNKIDLKKKGWRHCSSGRVLA
jgi:hypothetical protein